MKSTEMSALSRIIMAYPENIQPKDIFEEGDYQNHNVACHHLLDHLVTRGLIEIPDKQTVTITEAGMDYYDKLNQ